MSELPDHIARYMMGSAVATRSPAWVSVDKAGKVAGVGGRTDDYGLAGLVDGADLVEAAPYLQGLTPPERNLIVPMVALDCGRTVDVHLIAGDDTDCVLILDATEDARRQQRLQQAALEGRLIAEKSLDPALTGAVAAFGLLVLLRVQDAQFVVAGRRPDWAAPFVPERGDLDVTEVFPFLSSFLPDADRVWDGEREGPIRSGTWTEVSDAGDEVGLEATALLPEQSVGLLVVRNLGDELTTRRTVMQRAREQALEHDRLLKEVEKKEILLHCIVHDLKGPLTSLTSSLFLISSGKLSDEDAKSTLELGLRQSRRQERMITTILEVFRQDLGEQVDAEATANLMEVLEEELQAFRPAYDRAGTRLQMSAGKHGKDAYRVSGDAGRLGRVIANLLENALRHTPPEGLVVASIERLGDRVEVAIENEGTEVPKPLRARLFDRFSQDGESGGTSGLGLFYCRITVERWGGAIAYTPGKTGGSRFVFHLPVAESGC